MNKRNHIINTIVGVSLVLMLVIQFLPIAWTNTEVSTTLLKDTMMRFLAGLVFMLVLISFGYLNVFKLPKLTTKILLVLLPAFVVVINNFPIIAFLSGRTEITEPLGYIALFILSCFSIGWFEEIIFRGAVFTLFLQRFEKSKKGMFMAIVVSSAIFGLIHVVNLFAGAGIVPTILQVGYSFLMGMLFAVILLKTKTIWYSVILHAIYNFSGLFFRTVGTVDNQFDVATIIITTPFALATIYFYLRKFMTIKPDEIIPLYTPNTEVQDEA